MYNNHPHQHQRPPSYAVSNDEPSNNPFANSNGINSTGNGRFIWRGHHELPTVSNPASGAVDRHLTPQHQHHVYGAANHHQRNDKLQKIKESLQPYAADKQHNSYQQQTSSTTTSYYHVESAYNSNSSVNHVQQQQPYMLQQQQTFQQQSTSSQTRYSANNTVPRETEMLQELEKLGFERVSMDASLMALKLTQYKSVEYARNVLLSTNHPTNNQSPKLFSNRPSQQSPTSQQQQPLHNSTNNSNIPPNTSTTFQRLTTALDRAESMPPSTVPIRCVPRNNQRTPSPMINQPVSAQTSLPVTSKMEVAKSRKVEPALAYMANGLGGGNSDQSVESLNSRRTTPLATSTNNIPSDSHGASSHKVTITTNNVGAHSILICGDDDANDMSPTPSGQSTSQVYASSNGISQNGASSSNMSLPTATLFDDSVQPTQKEYIEQLCNRVTQMLNSHPIGGTTTQGSQGNNLLLNRPLVTSHLQLAAPYTRDSTASSTGSDPIFDQPTQSTFEAPSFTQIMTPTCMYPNQAPSVSTESSGNSAVSQSQQSSSCSPVQQTAQPTVIRSESPLPPSVVNRLRENKFRSPIKPFKSEAFRFFMEQHVENVIKQHKERRTRQMLLEREMTNAEFNDTLQQQFRAILAQKESKYLRSRRQKLNLSMFTKIKTIGVGAFGKVMLVRKNDTSALYAMKMLCKRDVIKLNQAAHVKAERDILAEANSDWIVKLFYSFQDKDNLFFIMEYIPGGDLMSLLIRKQIFTEPLAKFYTAELVIAIESVHKLGFIHRDIKPDNILIDMHGHIKLTDFGLCTGLRWTHDRKYYEAATDVAHIREDSFDLLRESQPSGEHKLLHFRRDRKRKKAHSLVGTSNYMAPEVLLCSGHTQLCDWWSVGVILYEMVIGCPPFYANTPTDTQYKVVNWRQYLRIQQMPDKPQLSNSCIDLILSLCCDQQDRLGQQNRGGAAQIKQHPWFEGINFESIRDTIAPHVPEILSPTDTSNFDDFDDPEPTGNMAADLDAQNNNSKLAANNNNGYNQSTLPHHAKQANPAFFEFTFRHFFDVDSSGGLVIRQPNHIRAPLAPVFEQRQQTHNVNYDSLTNGYQKQTIQATASSYYNDFEHSASNNTANMPTSTSYVHATPRALELAKSSANSNSANHNNDDPRTRHHEPERSMYV